MPPKLIIILNNLHLLPVDSDDRAGALFENGGHLEQEHVHLWLAVGRPDLLLLVIEDVRLPHVFPVETTEDQDLVLVHLGDTETLAGGELVRCEIHEFPTLLRLVIYALDAVNIFLACVGDTAENVHEAVLEGAAGMIVAALIQLREIKPNVNVCVVALCLIFGMLNLLPGASYDDELVAQRAGRVTVALILHSIFAQDAIGAILDHDFKALIEGVWCFLEVTATNQKEAASWGLHTLVVMREVHSHVDLVLQQLLCL